MLKNISLEKYNKASQIIDDYYKVRKEIFVDRLNWGLSLQNDKEIDQFDHNHCHYLLSVEKDKVIGGARLTSSIYPNLTFDYFQNQLSIIDPINRSSDLLELSRFGIKAIQQRSSSNFLKNQTLELIRGIFKFALTHGYKKIIAVTERRIERIVKFINIPIHHVSEIKKYGDTQVFIGTIEVTLDLYQELNDRYKQLKKDHN